MDVPAALGQRAHASPATPPPAFDAAAYAADPAAYVAHSVPGRAWQSQPPGPGVARLRLVGSSHITVPAGGAVTLHFQTVPGDPVSLLSHDLGVFDNGLTSISVRADEAGLARVRWHARDGVMNTARIDAASPRCSGIQHIICDVQP